MAGDWFWWRAEKGSDPVSYTEAWQAADSARRLGDLSADALVCWTCHEFFVPPSDDYRCPKCGCIGMRPDPYDRPPRR